MNKNILSLSNSFLNQKRKKSSSFLSLIKSFSKKQEILTILQKRKPSHYERVWLVGFLNYVGYSDMEIFEIIDNLNCWSDYNPKITKYQIQSVLRSIRKSKTKLPFSSPSLITRGGSSPLLQEFIKKGLIKPCELISELT